MPWLIDCRHSLDLANWLGVQRNDAERTANVGHVNRIIVERSKATVGHNLR